MPRDRDASAALIRDPNAPRALVAQLATATRFLTVLPIRGGVAPLAESALFFPLVGLGLGALLVTIDPMLNGAPAPARSVAVVALLALATGARQLAALARTARGLAGRAARRGLTTIDGAAVARGGAAGLRATLAGMAAVVLVLAAKLAALILVASPLRATALVLAPMLSRWSMVVMAFGSRARPGAPASPVLRSITFREFALASVLAWAIALVTADARALVAILVIAAVTIGARLIAHRRAGGIDADVVGAIGEVNEALVLVLMWLVGASARIVAAR